MDNSEFDFFPAACNEQTICSATFSELAKKAFERLSFTFSQEHLESLIEIALCKTSSKNDKAVAANLLKNAAIASKGVFALCQDTGIATVFGWKDGQLEACNEELALNKGIEEVYKTRNLRFSTVCASDFFSEYDPKNNLPAQIMLFQNSDEARRTQYLHFAKIPYYRFLFCAKGGGSSNKTVFIQGTKASLNETAFESLLTKHIRELGTAACPPYTIAVVVGGLSPEQNMLALKLASCGFYDRLKPLEKGANNSGGMAFRDAYWEERVLDIAAKTGYGAQFGGTALAVNAIVLRLPRHGASCPISLGVSCSAHRNLEAYITKDGFYLQKTCQDPALLPNFAEAIKAANKGQENSENKIILNTEEGIQTCLKKIASVKPGTPFEINGPIIVARDQAHAAWKNCIETEKKLPEYCTEYPILYAGPAQTPPQKPIGSFGPTTAGRMDSYGELLMSRGAALITLAKGNRSAQWTQDCKTYGAVYGGIIGGAAALIADEYITSSKVIDYEEFGMEAVRLITVKKLPAFVLTNGLGEDFYANLG